MQVIRERAKKAVSGRKCPSNSKGSTIIENLAQTKRLAETALGGSSSLPTPNKSAIVDDEKLTNTGSGSQVSRKSGLKYLQSLGRAPSAGADV